MNAKNRLRWFVIIIYMFIIWILFTFIRKIAKHQLCNIIGLAGDLQIENEITTKKYESINRMYKKHVRDVEKALQLREKEYNCGRKRIG